MLTIARRQTKSTKRLNRRRAAEDGVGRERNASTRACHGLSSSRGVVRIPALYRRGLFRSRHGIHNETLAAQQPPHLEPTYYCATGVEMPAFEPCKDKHRLHVPASARHVHQPARLHVLWRGILADHHDHVAGACGMMSASSAASPSTQCPWWLMAASPSPLAQRSPGATG